MEMAMTIQITTECGTQTVKVEQHFTDEQLEFYREQHRRALAGEPTLPDEEPVDIFTEEDKERIRKIEEYMRDLPSVRASEYLQFPKSSE